VDEHQTACGSAKTYQNIRNKRFGIRDIPRRNETHFPRRDAFNSEREYTFLPSVTFRNEAGNAGARELDLKS